MVARDRHTTPLPLVGVVVLALVCVHCHPRAGGGPAAKPPPGPTADPVAQAQIAERLGEVRREESRWRAGLVERRQLRERFAALPGSGAVGSAQKSLQFAGRQAGLGPMEISSRPTYEVGPLLRAQPVEIKAAGSWQAAGAMLAKVHQRLPKAGVLDYTMRRLRSARGGQPDEVQLTARVGIFLRATVPAAGGDRLSRKPIPADPKAALRALQGRLIAVRAAIADGERERQALAEALARPAEACVPVAALLGPLAPLLTEVQPTLVAGDRHSLRVEGSAPGSPEVERLRAALQTQHPLLAKAVTDEERRVPAGRRAWRTQFRITAHLHGSPALRPPPAPSPPAPAGAQSDTVPVDRAPPPAPVIGPHGGAGVPAPTGAPAEPTGPAGGPVEPAATPTVPVDVAPAPAPYVPAGDAADTPR